ncbi:MAG: hypothetical protein ACYCSN_13105 [Acidobacteriaceae bacterium]
METTLSSFSGDFSPKDGQFHAAFEFSGRFNASASRVGVKKATGVARGGFVWLPSPSTLRQNVGALLELLEQNRNSKRKTQQCWVI